MKFTDEELLEARRKLSHFVIRKSREMRCRFGIEFVLSPDAPQTLEGMQHAYRRCLVHGEKFPIWDGANIFLIVARS